MSLCACAIGSSKQTTAKAARAKDLRARNDFVHGNMTATSDTVMHVVFQAAEYIHATDLTSMEKVLGAAMGHGSVVSMES
jgi:hypothetical protein